MSDEIKERVEQLMESLRKEPPITMQDQIYTLGTLERALRYLRAPLTSMPEPSQEELRKAINNVAAAYSKRIILHTPQGKLEGMLEPTGWLGVQFIHYCGGRPAKHYYSQEDLRLEQTNPVPLFSTLRDVGCFPLYKENDERARERLARAGICCKKAQN